LFASIFESLKPGGWLIAQCGGGPNLFRLRQRVGEAMNLGQFKCFFQNWRDPWEFASAETTGQRLQNAGFVNIETWIEQERFELPDEDTLRQYLATVTLHRHLERITDAALRNRFLAVIVGRYREDGQHALDYWRLNIDATKPA